MLRAVEMIMVLGRSSLVKMLGAGEIIMVLGRAIRFHSLVENAEGNFVSDLREKYL